MAVIEDGTGTGKQVKVNSANRLVTQATSTSSALQATIDGTAWNINTGDVTLTSNAVAACIYFKNTSETLDFVLPAFAVGLGNLSGTLTTPHTITVIKNPTTGTIVDGAADCDMIVNRDFSQSDSLTGLAYKGGQANTFTDGTDIAQFYMTGNGRLYATIDMVIPPAKSVGVNIKLNATTGGSIYVALIGYYNPAV